VLLGQQVPPVSQESRAQQVLVSRELPAPREAQGLMGWMVPEVRLAQVVPLAQLARVALQELLVQLAQQVLQDRQVSVVSPELLVPPALPESPESLDRLDLKVSMV